MTYTNLIYYYLTCKQYCTNWYNSFIISTFGFTDMKISINNNHHSITFRYFLFMVLTNIMGLFNKLRTMIDITTTKAHITRITENGEKTIILEKDNVSLCDINKHLEIIEPSDSMLKQVFLIFELDNNDEKVCLKKYLVQYKDFEEEYQHTLENILFFNSIKTNNNSKINVKMFKGAKMFNLQLPYIDIKNKHINYFISL